MTNDNFERLVRSCQEYAARNPRLYRGRLFLLALLGHVYIGAVLLGLLGSAVLVGWLLARLGAGYAALKLALPLLGLSVLILRTLRVPIPAPAGIPLKGKAEPELFRVIEEVRRHLRAPRPSSVVLTDELNAFVMQCPRFGLFGERRHLAIGLPLLEALSPSEFRAVLAHEFAHLAGAHARFSAWIYGVRARWAQLLWALTAAEHWGVFLFLHFFRWYVPYFQAYSFVLVRAHEYDADRGGAEAATREDAASALLRIAVVSRFLQRRFYPSMQRLAAERAEPPGDLHRAMSEAIRRAFDDERAGTWIAQELAGETGAADTHPSLTARLSALGVEPDARWIERVVARGKDAERAIGLLRHADAHVAKLDGDWATAVRMRWAENHRALKGMRDELETLERGARKTKLTAGAALRRVALTAEVKGEEAAVLQARAVAHAQADAPAARFLLGRLLAQLDDAEAVEHLEAAMTQDPALVETGVAIAHSLLRRIGRDGEAAGFLKRWEVAARASGEAAWAAPAPGSEPDLPYEATSSELETAGTDTAAAAVAAREYRMPRSVAELLPIALLGALVIAGTAVVVWSYRIPYAAGSPFAVLSGALAVASLVLIALRLRRPRRHIVLHADHGVVTSGRRETVIRWGDVDRMELRRQAILVGLRGAARRIRLSASRREFAELLNTVVPAVLEARRSAVGAQAGTSGAAMTTATSARPVSRTFYRPLRVYAFILAMPVLALVIGAFTHPGLYLFGIVCWTVVLWRIARAPFAVRVGIDAIRILTPASVHATILRAVSDVGVTLDANGAFTVAVRNRAGHTRTLPAVDGDFLGLYDAVSRNLEAVARVAGFVSSPPPARKRFLRFALAATILTLFVLYLPVMTGLAISEMARVGNLRGIDMLLAAGAPIDGRGVRGRTAVYQAAKYGHLETVKALVQRGANIHLAAADPDYTPLHVAAEYNHLDVMEFLLDTGADPEVTNASGWTPLHRIAHQRGMNNVAAARLLIERGAAVDGEDVDGNRPFGEAVASGNLPLAELLLQAGADANAADRSRTTAMHSAARAGNVAMIEFLAGAGVHIDARNHGGWTPLAMAAQRGHAAATSRLLALGARWDVYIDTGFEPLHLAVWAGHADVVRILLQAGADPEKPSANRGYPLQIAAVYGFADVAQALLDHGADPNRPANGTTALLLAREYRHFDVERQLAAHVINR